MAIEHVDIGSGEIHEPKGVATALLGETYVADGAGSGEWKLEQAYGEMQILQNSTALSLTAAADAALYTTTDYIKIAGIWQAGTTDGVTYNNNELTVPTTGVYYLAGWSNVTASVNNVLLGVKYSVNGTVLPSAVAPTLRRKQGTGTDIGSLAGIGLVPLTAGDVVALHVACDTTCDVTITDAGLALTLVKA